MSNRGGSKGLRILPQDSPICMACGNNVNCVVAFMTNSVRDGKLVTNSGAQRAVKICRECVKTLAEAFGLPEGRTP